MKMIFSLYLMLCAVGFIHMFPVSKESIKQTIMDMHGMMMEGKKNLTWNDGLAKSAEELARSCDTNKLAGQAINYGYDTYRRVADPIGYVSNIMDTWYGEKELMAMANATNVGCGANMCRTFRASGKEYNDVFDLVCMYKAAPCKDSVDEQECQGWAALGECGRNPERMLVECKKTCEVC